MVQLEVRKYMCRSLAPRYRNTAYVKAMSMDEKVLSFGDVLLRQGDLDILSGPFWLNDRIIEFYLQYLQSKATPLERVMLVGPSVTFWLAKCPGIDDARSTLASLQFGKKEVVLFVINDNEQVETKEGGSHWSLLLYQRSTSSFHHFDSLGKSNWRPAKALVHKLQPVTGTSTINMEPTPQQVNGYDCGMYVLAIANVIWDTLVVKGHVENLPSVAALIKQTVTESFVIGLRKESLVTIRTLVADKG